MDYTNNSNEILIAEHERFLLRVLTRGLNQPDRRIVAISSGEEILQRLRATPPAVLIVDTGISPMGGEELCRRIQTEMPERAFLTCVLTDCAEDEYGNYAEWFANFRMLEKPVSVGRLRRFIDDHLIDNAA
ncbi:MAG: two-component system response regulator [Gammaproteobacteria bacterium]